ncbi:MAG: restriction endonuclease subunit S [Selenomonadaceae bacterium]|nr:restriction endonuclease subunit S [Selenomonadaceae bacterium]
MFGDPLTNPLKWEVKSVIDLCDCMVPGRDKPKRFTGATPWITIDDLNPLSVTKTSKKSLGLTDEEIEEVNRKKVPANSVLMSCVGNLGICSIAGNELIINQQLHSFQCDQNVNPYYLMYSLSWQKAYMEAMATKTTVLYMNKSVCNSIPIMKVPVNLQNKFADFVEQADKSKVDGKFCLSTNFVQWRYNKHNYLLRG